MNTHMNQRSDTWIVEYADGDTGVDPCDIPAPDWHVAVHASERSIRARCHTEAQARQYVEQEASRSLEQPTHGRVYRIRDILSGETRHLTSTVRRRASARTTTVTIAHQWTAWPARHPGPEHLPRKGPMQYRVSESPPVWATGHEYVTPRGARNALRRHATTVGRITRHRQATGSAGVVAILTELSTNTTWTSDEIDAFERIGGLKFTTKAHRQVMRDIAARGGHSVASQGCAMTATP